MYCKTMYFCCLIHTFVSDEKLMCAYIMQLSTRHKENIVAFSAIALCIFKLLIAILQHFAQQFPVDCGVLTLIRTVFLRDLIGTYVDNCQHAVFTCFLMLIRCVFNNIFCHLVMDLQD